MDNDKKEKALRDHRFECQCCGFCCSERAIIYPSYEEVQNLAGYMNISVLSFSMRYLREVYNPQMNLYALSFKTGASSESRFGCIFNHNKLCTIYDSQRTELCNVFPWNHFNTETDKWDNNFVSKEGEFWCPGIGKGREWTLDEIKCIKNAYPKVGANAKIHYNSSPDPELGINEIETVPITNVTMAEQEILHKLRSLSIERKREIEQLLNTLYHHI